jgi:hypothetical protein
MPLSEMSVSLGGTITEGQFNGDAISGPVTQEYIGGPTCGVFPPRKRARKVRRGGVVGTMRIS